MPELAEVEAVRRQIEKRMVGHKIKTVVADDTDRWLFAFVDIPEVKKALGTLVCNERRNHRRD